MSIVRSVSLVVASPSLSASVLGVAAVLTLEQSVDHCEVHFIIHLIIRAKWLYQYNDFI